MLIFNLGVSLSLYYFMISVVLGDGSPSKITLYTVNGERFDGLNFHGFRGFHEHRKSFSVNISITLK